MYITGLSGHDVFRLGRPRQAGRPRGVGAALDPAAALVYRATVPEPGLNRAQRDAVSTLSGPLLVLAGAGTGKTRVITHRIAELIRHRTRADRILAMTFTNKAAKEMRERAIALLGRRRKRGQPSPEISTFHSLCVRVLRRHATALGYPREFTIYDRSDQETLARQALRDVRVGHQSLKPSELIFIVSGWKSQGVRADSALDVATSDKEQLAALAYGKYQSALFACGALDFDDLLLKVEELFTTQPEVRFAEATRFDHILIDEYQDTNGLQYRIVRALAERHRNLCVVGDDDQSIYGWRGAEVSHILNFQRDWPEAKVVRLEENYRSRAPILELANRLIAHNTERHPKVLVPCRGAGPAPRFVGFEDESEESAGVVREIAWRVSPDNPERVPASDVAILFRTNEQPRPFELELRRAKVPYVLIGGQSFYDRKEVRDILAYLRVLANPADEVSLLRIINTPSRGIGTSSIETLLSVAVKAGASLWHALPEALASGLLPAHVGARVTAFRALIERHRAALGQGSLAAGVRALIEEVGYRDEVERVYKSGGEVEARWASVEDAVNAVAQYEQRDASPSLLGFLEETSLSGREDDRDDKDRRELRSVTLMTLHSAKGLEFPHVYLVGMEEGLLPHKRSVADGGHTIAEERRLAYVGVTRAQETLTLSTCKARMKWGKLRPQIPSRFLAEMRGETERAARLAEAAAQAIRREQQLAERAAPAGKSKRSTRGDRPAPARARQPSAPAEPAAEAVLAPRPPQRDAKAHPPVRPEEDDFGPEAALAAVEALLGFNR